MGSIPIFLLFSCVFTSLGMDIHKWSWSIHPVFLLIFPQNFLENLPRNFLKILPENSLKIYLKNP